MKLFQQQDDQGMKRRSKTAKALRRMKNKRERKAARMNPEIPPTYGKYRDYAL